MAIFPMAASKKIKGRYEVKGILGEGGMGVVYRAYDPPPMDRDVALKTLLEFPDRMSLQLFYKECEVLKSMSHPNIVEIFDMGEFDDAGHKKPFFVMPLLRGQALDDIIRTAPHRLTVDRVIEIMSQTCRGLQAAHEQGLIHRDLKPSNLFVMEDDAVKIIDFGVVHTVDARSRSSGFQKGTLLYMAPEQVQFKPVSPQSDLFSLGVVCYEALTRRQPFRLTTEEEIVNAILTSIPPPASEINPAVNQTVSRVIHKAMAKQAWNRFDSAREFGESLQKALRNEPLEIFDPARIKPRIQRAAKALEGGDYQFASEIVGELEAEGNKLAHDFAGKLIVAALQRLGRPLNPRLDSGRIENLERLIAQSFLQRLSKLPRTVETVPGLLGHRFMNDATDSLVHRWIDFRSRGGNACQNRVNDFLFSRKAERLAARKRLVAHDSQRKKIRLRRHRLKLHLLGRHVKQ